VAYWDTSALLKLYVDEPDSSEFWGLLLGSKHGVRTCTEMYCALRKKENLKELKAGGAAALFDKFRQDVANGRVALLGLRMCIGRPSDWVSACRKARRRCC
jgi:hypothetical protein